MYGKPVTTARQGEYCLRLIQKPAVDDARYEKVWKEQVLALRDVYEMNP
jgi:acyl-CoA dehydrogenase